MKFGISAALILFALFGTAAMGAENLRAAVLRDRAIDAGLVPVEELAPSVDPAKSAAGKLLFESTKLSLSGETSCQSCHLDKFSSADGLPVGVGTRGIGEGLERAMSGGDILPRNTLPLWGRGSPGFDVFFWDGKVEVIEGEIVSQFGTETPSEDPFAVATHLPIVEIREMVSDDDAAKQYQQETLGAAVSVYEQIESRIRNDEPLSTSIIDAFSVKRSEIKVLQIAEALAAFIRDRFQVRQTRFHTFVFGIGGLDTAEVEGGLVFYGRGRCSACHNGPLFSDLKFHAIPFGQFGFGKNGFGIDYGRFNVTRNADDLYKFRTPPLINVTRTGPYSHSGSVANLSEAIRSHVDPLTNAEAWVAEPIARAEFYKRLRLWSREPVFGVELDDTDISNLVKFLRTLEQIGE